MKFLAAFAFILLFISAAAAQDKTTGNVKGKVRLVSGDSISGVTVEARQDGKTIETARTDNKGDFIFVGLKPGVYRFIFNKDGLSEGVSQPVEVKAKTTLTLKKLFMSIDKGTQAVIRGSVFDEAGRSVAGAKIEALQIVGSGTRKVEERYTSESGEFTFRLPPANARYRFRVTVDGAQPTAKDFDVDGGAQIYRFSITLKAVKE